MLQVLSGWSPFANLKSQISELINKSENISRQLYGWIESLKNSEFQDSGTWMRRQEPGI